MFRRVMILMVAVLATMVASAFDSTEWLGKRAVMTREAERLRSVYSNCLALAVSPASDVSVPVETFDDGTVKTLVYAKRGQYFLDSGLIWAEGVEVKTFTQEGALDGQLNAEYCVVDRQSKSGWAEGRAKVVHEGTVFTGRNAYFSSADSYVKVFEDSRVEMKTSAASASKEIGLGGAARGKGTNETVVVAGREGDFDRKDGVAMFEGAVTVDYDGQYQLAAERAFAFLGVGNSLSRVVALGGVAITNGTRNGSCARAIYRRAAGEIEMFGDGERTARLAETGENASELEGRRIRFWLMSEQAEVDRSVMRVKETGKERVL